MTSQLSDSTLHDRSRGNLRHWMLCSLALDEVGNLLFAPTPGGITWGATIALDPGVPRSVGVVAMPLPGPLPLGVKVVQKVRVHEVYVHLFEADDTHDIHSPITFPQVVVPAFSVPVNIGSGTALIAPNSSNTLTLVGWEVGPSVPSAGSWSSNLGELANALATTSVVAGLTSVGGTYSIPKLPVSGTIGVPAVNSVIQAQTDPFMTMMFPTYHTSPGSLGSLKEPGLNCFNITAIAMYVSVMGSDGRYSVKDPLVPPDPEYDFLDLKTDVVYLPAGQVRSFTSREWVMKLPYEVEIGPGEAIIVTISYTSACGSTLTVIPFCRALVTDLR